MESEKEAFEVNESDEESVASLVESAAADEAEEAHGDLSTGGSAANDSGEEEVVEPDEPGEPDELGDVRAASGSYVILANGYFTITDHPGFPDMTCKVVPRWAKEGEMGRTKMSKTIVCAHY